MIKAVLFDMDGTVLDTMPLYMYAWRYTSRKMKVNLWLEDILPHVCGMNKRDISTYIRKHYGEDFPVEEYFHMRDTELHRYMEENGIPLKPGVRECLAEVRRMGLVSALATSTESELALHCLELGGLHPDDFDVVVTGDRVTKSKPDPEIFLLGAKLAGVKPEECVVAEDAINGVLAGSAAGMRVAMIPDRMPCNDEIRPKLWHLCKTLAELPALIAEENRRMTE